MNYWKASDSPCWAKIAQQTHLRLPPSAPPFRCFPPSTLRRIPKYATFEMKVATTGGWVVREFEYRRGLAPRAALWDTAERGKA